MKQRLTAILLALILLLTITGCSAANAAQKLDAAEDAVEEKLDTVEDNVEHAVRRAVSPTTVSTAPVSTQAPAAAITQEEAEKIALDYLGLTAGQVQRMRTGYEIDDGIPQYDVEFHEGDWEYEFEISAEDGKILSFDKDHKYD